MSHRHCAFETSDDFGLHITSLSQCQKADKAAHRAKRGEGVKGPLCPMLHSA